MIPVRVKVVQISKMSHARKLGHGRFSCRLFLPESYDWHPGADAAWWRRIARDIMNAGLNTGMDVSSARYEFAAYNASVADCENAERAVIEIVLAREGNMAEMSSILEGAMWARHRAFVLKLLTEEHGDDFNLDIMTVKAGLESDVEAGLDRLAAKMAACIRPAGNHQASM